MEDVSRSVVMFVVEAFEWCECHTIVTARFADQQHWAHIMVRKPLEVNFGDKVLAKTDHKGQLIPNSLYLWRGPNLAFHMILDDMDPMLGEYLVQTSPAFTMYNDDQDHPTVL